jgi:DNA-binding transcriptional regulator YiaG
MTKRETREEKIRKLLEREEHCPACNGRGSHHVLDGGELRALRLKAGVEQKALAQAAGISAPYLNQMEHRVKKLNLPLADQLLKALGI